MSILKDLSKKITTDKSVTTETKNVVPLSPEPFNVTGNRNLIYNFPFPSLANVNTTPVTPDVINRDSNGLSDYTSQFVSTAPPIETGTATKTPIENSLGAIGSMLTDVQPVSAAPIDKGSILDITPMKALMLFAGLILIFFIFKRSTK